MIAMGTLIGSLMTAGSITLTDPIVILYIQTMPVIHAVTGYTAVTNVAHSKLFSISI